MNIALIAHDAKKELMVQFCIAYCGVLSASHDLCATGTTGKLVSGGDGPAASSVFCPAPHGGDQQIAARIACNEIDLLLFFRDPISAKPHEPNEMQSAAPVRRTQYPHRHQYRHGRGAHPWAGARRSGLAQYRQPQPLNVCRKPRLFAGNA